jgi:hypothetical protein
MTKPTVIDWTAFMDRWADPPADKRAYMVWVGEERDRLAQEKHFRLPNAVKQLWQLTPEERAKLRAANILGAVGEGSFAWWGRRAWTPNIGGRDKGVGDVDGWEVRTSAWRDAPLPIKPRDRHQKHLRAVLLTRSYRHAPTRLVVRGSILIADAFRPEWHVPARGGYAERWDVPQEALTMAELEAWRDQVSEEAWDAI